MFIFPLDVQKTVRLQLVAQDVDMLSYGGEPLVMLHLLWLSWIVLG